MVKTKYLYFYFCFLQERLHLCMTGSISICTVKYRQLVFTTAFINMITIPVDALVAVLCFVPRLLLGQPQPENTSDVFCSYCKPFYSRSRHYNIRNQTEARMPKHLGASCSPLGSTHYSCKSSVVSKQQSTLWRLKRRVCVRGISTQA